MSQASDAAPVTAVIVTYQSAKTISRALAGAHRCHLAGLLDTLVVDNGTPMPPKTFLSVKRAGPACC